MTWSSRVQVAALAGVALFSGASCQTSNGANSSELHESSPAEKQVMFYNCDARLFLEKTGNTYTYQMTLRNTDEVQKFKDAGFVSEDTNISDAFIIKGLRYIDHEPRYGITKPAGNFGVTQSGSTIKIIADAIINGQNVRHEAFLENCASPLKQRFTQVYSCRDDIVVDRIGETYFHQMVIKNSDLIQALANAGLQSEQPAQDGEFIIQGLRYLVSGPRYGITDARGNYGVQQESGGDIRISVQQNTAGNEPIMYTLHNCPAF